MPEGTTTASNAIARTNVRINGSFECGKDEPGERKAYSIDRTHPAVRDHAARRKPACYFFAFFSFASFAASAFSIFGVSCSRPTTEPSIAFTFTSSIPVLPGTVMSNE